MRVLLVSPPWRLPNLTSLSVGTLGPILRAAGIEVDELHGATLFPKTESTFELLEIYGKYLFVPSFTGCDIDSFLDRVVEDRIAEANMGEVVMPAAEVTVRRLGFDEISMKASLRADLHSAQICVDRMTERMLQRTYDVVGFSCTFDDQVPAALTLARNLKKARPETKVMIGGAACAEEQADGLVTSFAELDAVCHTEGEAVIVPLVRALAGNTPLADVPGISWRDAAGGFVHNPSPPLLRDLDTLPFPDYRPWMEQYDASEWSTLKANTPPRLMFETSRGCWWGQKSLCTFCGLNAEGLAFRSKSADRAVAEIRQLWELDERVKQLQAADNIVDVGYYQSVFPRLKDLAADPVRPLKIFYEVKTNMKPDQVEALGRGGVNIVQPGIESFSDEVLALMRKGCTALGQVQFIKWAAQSNVLPLYNVIMRNPGEKAEWYRAMSKLLPALGHLTPPTSVVTMHLERFSPYFMRPEEWGLTNLRPRDYYQMLYPYPGVDLERIAYQFDFEHPSHNDRELIAALQECHHVLTHWQKSYRPDTLVYADLGGSILIVDKRNWVEQRSTIGGMGANLFLYIDQHRSRTQIAEALPELDGQVVDMLLESWIHKGWVVEHKGRYLALVPRKGPALTKAQVVKKASRALPLATSSASLQ